MVAWMRSPNVCAVVVSPKPVATGVGVGVETASSVERVSVVSDLGEGDAAGGGEAAEHPKLSASRMVVVAFAEICLKVAIAQISQTRGSNRLCERRNADTLAGFGM